jgi:hypothetical protein
MKKEILLSRITENHRSFIDYLSNLSKEDYEFSNDQKWTAGQQLEHIVLCVKPLVQFFSLDKTVIERYHGTTCRQNRTYEALLGNYVEKLTAGGKAPDKYVPETNSINERENLIEILEALIKELNLKIETFSDQELDSLQIPHPLLGNLTLREMLYNAVYHVEHHLVTVKSNLKNKDEKTHKPINPFGSSATHK